MEELLRVNFEGRAAKILHAACRCEQVPMFGQISQAWSRVISCLRSAQTDGRVVENGLLSKRGTRYEADREMNRLA
jgi:hypothetical protein